MPKLLFMLYKQAQLLFFNVFFFKLLRFYAVHDNLPLYRRGMVNSLKRRHVVGNFTGENFRVFF